MFLKPTSTESGTATVAHSFGKLPSVILGDIAVPNVYAHCSPLQKPVFTQVKIKISVSTDSTFVQLLSGL